MYDVSGLLTNSLSSSMKFRSFLLLASAWFLVACGRKPDPEIAFYFSAHPDDWQLFMGEKAYEDVQNEHVKTVFFLTTAGDAAMGMTASANANLPYFKARERGYINALNWTEESLIKINEEGRSLLSLTDYELSDVVVNGHVLKKYEGKTVLAYLFYLPDGFPEGQYQWSLQKLYRGEISQMPTIDSTTVYKDWDDLKATLKTLVNKEVGEMANVWVNLAERDTVLNPADHSDHWYTSLLGDEATAHLNSNKRYYREYAMADLDTNLEGKAVDIKRFLFSANAASKEQAGYSSPWDDHHLAWVVRSYYREER